MQYMQFQYAIDSYEWQPIFPLNFLLKSEINNRTEFCFDLTTFHLLLKTLDLQYFPIDYVRD